MSRTAQQDTANGMLLGEQDVGNYWSYTWDGTRGFRASSRWILSGANVDRDWIISGNALLGSGSGPARSDTGQQGGFQLGANTAATSRAIFLKRPLRTIGTSGFNTMSFKPSEQPYIWSRIGIPTTSGGASGLALCEFKVGFRLTHPALISTNRITGTTVTDADNVYFAFDSAKHATRLYVLESVGSTTFTLTDTSVDLVAGGEYLLQIKIGGDSKAKCYVNSGGNQKLVRTTAVLTADAAFIPMPMWYASHSVAGTATDRKRIKTRKFGLGKRVALTS